VRRVETPLAHPPRLLALLDKVEEEGSEMIENAFVYKGWQA
jgi:hypothetical protein